MRISKNKYVGNFKNGFLNGKGKYLYPNGSHYEGNWEKGKRSGKGIFISINGDRYEGEF